MHSTIFAQLKLYLLCGLALILFAPLHNAGAQSFSVLYAFHGGRDGAGPVGTLLRDGAGNLYGMTGNGGGACHHGGGCGTAYKLGWNGTETVLYAFRYLDNGRYPSSGLITDKSGDLFGTTDYGGTGHCFRHYACGTVFKLTRHGTETVVHSFNKTDGYNPANGLVEDKAGNLYGTIFYTGNSSCFGGVGCGLVFKVASDGTETSFYKFQGGNDGANPDAGLIKDEKGNFYGTTSLGGGGTACNGNPPSGCGTVFKLTPDATETILYAFSGGSDGSGPNTGVILDKKGDLFGTTIAGGANGRGVVFEITPDGTESVLHSFAGGSDGEEGPTNAPLLYYSGKLYGTTLYGGSGGSGTIFSLALDGTETILHSFTGNPDGLAPEGALVPDESGNLIGTTTLGGDFGFGIVFSLKK